MATEEGRPEILSVNFAVTGIHRRHNHSAALEIRAPHGHVAFEGDHIEPSTPEGWDVLVTGEGPTLLTPGHQPAFQRTHATLPGASAEVFLTRRRPGPRQPRPPEKANRRPEKGH